MNGCAVLLRLVACIAIYVGCTVTYLASLHDRSSGILLIFPMIGLLPAILWTLLILCPIEASLVRSGGAWLLVVVLPALAGLMPVVFMVLLAVFWGQLDRVQRSMELASSPWLVLMAAAWGLLWWVSGIVARLVERR